LRRLDQQRLALAHRNLIIDPRGDDDAARIRRAFLRRMGKSAANMGLDKARPDRANSPPSTNF